MYKIKIYSLISIFFCFTCTVVTLKHPIVSNLAIPSEWEDENIIILSDSLTLELKSGQKRNSLNMTRTIWYKINNSVPATLKEVVDRYSEYVEEKPIISIIAIYKSGKYKKITNIKHLKDLYYVNSLYKHKPHYFIQKAHIPNYSDIAFLRYSVKRRFHQTKNCSDRYGLRSDYPVQKKVIQLIWPTSYELNFGLENAENLTIQSNKIVKNNKNIFTVEGNSLQPIKSINNKYPELWYAALFVSFPPVNSKSFSWEELGDFYLQELSDSLKDKDASFLDSLAKGIQGLDENEIIDNTFKYVKDNIRYYGSWEKAYSIIPRDPKMVFKNGYGDCKELSTILAFLLRRKNVKVWLTLVNTKGFQYLEKYPTLGAFDHLIVCVEKMNGNLLFLDPTNKVCTTNTSYHWVLGQKALIIKENGSYTYTINPDRFYKNEIKTVSKIEPLSDRGDWSIKGTVIFNGAIAGQTYKAIKLRENVKESELLINTLKNVLQIKANKVTLDKLEPLSVTIGYFAPFSHYITNNSGRSIIFAVPSLYTPNQHFSDLSNEGNRYLYEVNQTDTWIIPKDFNTFNFTNLSSKYSKGTWNSTNENITRIYSCEFKHIDESEREYLGKMLSKKNEFSRGIAWAE